MKSIRSWLAIVALGVLGAFALASLGDFRPRMSAAVADSGPEFRTYWNAINDTLIAMNVVSDASPSLHDAESVFHAESTSIITMGSHRRLFLVVKAIPPADSVAGDSTRAIRVAFQIRGHVWNPSANGPFAADTNTVALALGAVNSAIGLQDSITVAAGASPGAGNPRGYWGSELILNIARPFVGRSSSSAYAGLGRDHPSGVVIPVFSGGENQVFEGFPHISVKARLLAGGYASLLRRVRLVVHVVTAE